MHAASQAGAVSEQPAMPAAAVRLQEGMQEVLPEYHLLCQHAWCCYGVARSATMLQYAHTDGCPASNWCIQLAAAVCCCPACPMCVLVGERSSKDSASTFSCSQGPCCYSDSSSSLSPLAILQVPFQSFAMQPLAGAHVCITNFSSTERAAIQQQAEAAGAAFSAELHKDRCTHLICKTAVGAKYK